MAARAGRAGGEDVERELEVRRAARERPGDRRAAARAARPASAGCDRARDEPVARLVAVDAAEVRGAADGAADVAAQLQRREARGDGRGRAARRAARRARRVPRVVRRPVDGVVALVVGGGQRQVRLAEGDRARRAQPRDGVRVALGPVPGEMREPAGRRHPDDLAGVLDRHRQAVERAAPLGRRRVRRPRGLARALDVERDDGVQLAVQAARRARAAASSSSTDPSSPERSRATRSPADVSSGASLMRSGVPSPRSAAPASPGCGRRSRPAAARSRPARPA